MSFYPRTQIMLSLTILVYYEYFTHNRLSQGCTSFLLLLLSRLSYFLLQLCNVLFATVTLCVRQHEASCPPASPWSPGVWWRICLSSRPARHPAAPPCQRCTRRTWCCSAPRPSMSLWQHPPVKAEEKDSNVMKRLAEHLFS